MNRRCSIRRLAGVGAALALAGALLLPGYTLRARFSDAGDSLVVEGHLPSPAVCWISGSASKIHLSKNGTVVGSVVCPYSLLDYPRLIALLDKERVFVAFQADIKLVVAVIDLRAGGLTTPKVSPELSPFFQSSCCDIRPPSRAEVSKVIEILERDAKSPRMALAPTLWCGSFKFAWKIGGLKTQLYQQEKWLDTGTKSHLAN
jgi:hypothetical protein